MKSKIFVSFFGTCIVLVSIYFITIQFVEHKTALLAWRPEFNDLVMLSIATFGYALANYLLAFSWITLLGEKNHEIIPIYKLIGIYGKSQIAKYIPGNIAHIGGRHVLANSAGIVHQDLVSAAIFEIAGLLTAATMVSLSGLPSFSEHIELLKWAPFFAPILLMGYLILPKIFKIIGLKKKGDTVKLTKLIISLILYVTFFLIAGLAMMLLTWNHQDEFNSVYLLLSLTTFAIAWSAGFVTPGSPSGIGVRESLLILLLSPSIGAEFSIIVAFLFRIVTVLGDLIFMLLTLIGEMLCSSNTNVPDRV